MLLIIFNHPMIKKHNTAKQSKIKQNKAKQRLVFYPVV